MAVTYNPSTGKLERVNASAITDDQPDRENPNYYQPNDRPAEPGAETNADADAETQPAAVMYYRPDSLDREPGADAETLAEPPAIDYENYSGREQRIRIAGELLTIDKVNDYGGLPMIETSDGCEYYLAANGSCNGLADCSVDIGCAGCAAEQYYRDMAANDVSEFECMIGSENLIALALGQPAAPGSRTVRSLDQWFELCAEVPEEQFGSYDGSELDVDRFGTIADDIGFEPTIAYRHN